MVRSENASALPSSLRDILLSLPPFALAFSGGVDSRFLAHAAKLCDCDFLLIHARGPHVPEAETACALEWARKKAIPVTLVDYDPLAVAGVRQNGRDRCYWCKKALFTKLACCGRTLVDGTNAGDLGQFRPGLRALRELDIFSPLAEAGLDKMAVRQSAVITGLENPGQKARPCLLTRFAYGTGPDYKTLSLLGAAEKELFEIFGSETDFRLRLVPEALLQTVACTEGQKKDVDRVMLKYGFSPCKIIIGENISGFFDRHPVKTDNFQ